MSADTEVIIATTIGTFLSLSCWFKFEGIGVADGKLSVAVIIGVTIAVGNGIGLGAGVVVGADTGAQADSIKLTSKNTINVRFIVRVLLWRSSRPTID